MEQVEVELVLSEGGFLAGDGVLAGVGLFLLGLVLVDLVSDLGEKVVSNVLEGLHVGRDCADRGVDLAQ